MNASLSLRNCDFRFHLTTHLYRSVQHRVPSALLAGHPVIDVFNAVRYGVAVGIGVFLLC